MEEILGTDGRDKLVGTVGQDFISSGKGDDIIRGDVRSEVEATAAAVETPMVNLIVDGSFEAAAVRDNAWSNFESVGAWQSDTRIEVWGKDFLGTSATDGDKVVELDYDNGQSNLFQDVQTSAGQTYEFSFDFAQRDNTKSETNTIEVWWNGEKVGSVTPDSTAFSQASFEVVGTGGQDRIEFREEAGDNDSLGGMIDNVKLMGPAPGATAVLAAVPEAPLSQDDIIDAGTGDDRVFGMDGDDFIMGGGGDDRLAGNEGNDTIFGSSSATGDVDMSRFQIQEDVKGTVTFLGESAGFKNVLGMYKIGKDGAISDVDILFANASLKGSGGDLISGQSAVDIDLDAGDRLGFFVVPNGYSKGGMADLLASPDSAFRFVDADGNPANVNGDGELRLVHTSIDGEETDMKSQYGTSVFHSIAGDDYNLNVDGMDHVKGSVNVLDGQVRIGFEDLKNGGDEDYDDSVFLLDIGMTNAALLPRISDGDGTSSDDDHITGNQGTDQLFGMRGDDLVKGGQGDDEIWGNSGNDDLRGGAGNDNVRGGSGDDVLRGGSGDDQLSGNSGNDTLRGGAGDDELMGNSGNDVLNGGRGNDNLDGGSGNDRFVALDGDDYINGGSGFDTLTYKGADAGVAVDLSKHVATGETIGTDEMWSIEALRGSEFDDTLKGDKRANVIDGGAGDDVIRSLGGEDTLIGGEGSDRFQWFAKDVEKAGEHLGVDRIRDFSTEEGDILDFSRMIDGSPESIEDHVILEENEQGTVVSLMLGERKVEVVQLDGAFDLDANDLHAEGLILA